MSKSSDFEREMLEEVRALRSELREMREGVPPRPEGEGWVLFRPLTGGVPKWAKRDAAHIQ